LAKAAANNLAMPEGTFYQELQAPATAVTTKAFKEIPVTESEDWRQLIIDQINNVHHPEDKASASRMAARARSYTIVDITLYKKSIVQPLHKCISQSNFKRYT